MLTWVTGNPLRRRILHVTVTKESFAQYGTRLIFHIQDKKRQNTSLNLNLLLTCFITFPNCFHKHDL